MDTRVNTKIFLKTVFLFPLFMIFIMFPLCVLIVITAFLPKGRVLATKLYEFFGWIGIVLVGVELNVIGAEKIDTKKSYVVRIPIFGRVLKTLGLPRIDRKNAKANFEKINDSINQVIKLGNSIMIFPEGKRSNQKELLPFKKGASHIAKDFNLPIIPVVSHNAHNLMVKGKVWLKSGEIKIEILEPIYNVNDYTVDELTSKMESLIKGRL